MKSLFVVSIACALFSGCQCDLKEEKKIEVSQTADGEITKNVRKVLAADSTLSTNAKMIGISTSDGVVTLTGVVENEEEGRKIVKMAKGVQGVSRVNKQLTTLNP